MRRVAEPRLAKAVMERLETAMRKNDEDVYLTYEGMVDPDTMVLRASPMEAVDAHDRACYDRAIRAAMPGAEVHHTFDFQSASMRFVIARRRPSCACALYLACVACALGVLAWHDPVRWLPPEARAWRAWIPL